MNDSNPIQDLVSGIQKYIHGNDSHAIILAILIFIATLIIARVCTVLMRKLLQRNNSPLPSSSILINVVRIIIWIIGLSLILAGCFNVNVNGILTALGVGGIAVSLGLQNTIQNFFGGLMITFMKIIKPGDHVVVGSTEGIVEDVTWRQTIVRDFEGIAHVIPNSIINSEEVRRMNPAGLVIAPFTIAFTGEDLDKQLATMEADVKKAIQAKAPLRNDPTIKVTTVGSGSVSARLYFAVKDKRKVRDATDIAMRTIAKQSVVAK